MTDFNSVFNAASQLPNEERLRLIEALWQTLPAEDDFPLHSDWAAELERRVAQIESGSAHPIGWATIRDEALARAAHGCRD